MANGEGIGSVEEPNPHGEGHASVHHVPVDGTERARAEAGDAIGVSKEQLKAANKILQIHSALTDEQYAGVFNLPFNKPGDNSYSTEHRRAMQREGYMGTETNRRGQFPVIKNAVPPPPRRSRGARGRGIVDRTVGEAGRQLKEFATTRWGVRHIIHHFKFRNYRYAEPAPRKPAPSTTLYITQQPKGGIARGQQPKGPESPSSPTEPEPVGPRGPRPGGPATEAEQIRAMKEQLRQRHEAQQNYLDEELRKRGEGPDAEPGAPGDEPPMGYM